MGIVRQDSCPGLYKLRVSKGGIEFLLSSFSTLLMACIENRRRVGLINDKTMIRISVLLILTRTYILLAILYGKMILYELHTNGSRIYTYRVKYY